MFFLYDKDFHLYLNFREDPFQILDLVGDGSVIASQGSQPSALGTF